MKFVFKIIILSLLVTSCQDEPVISLAEKYESITNFQSIAEFPNAIDESSGLVYENNKIWTHNDGGDAPNLYQIDKSNGTILTTLNIENAENNDWEDLTDDSLYFYIADIGNNRGNRQDLNILKLLKPTNPIDTSYEANQINFSYGDQNSFVFQKEMHDFNAEALISVEDSLYIFTKNHISQDTRCYSIPKNPSTYEISSSARFNTEGLITAADFDEKNKVLVLLGYNKNIFGHAPFIWCFWDFENNDFFQGKKKRFNLNFSEQTEGITFSDSGVILISSEKEDGIGGNIWKIDLKPVIPGLW